MSGDVHVRFCEGPGVRSPRATHLVICCRGTGEQALATLRSMMQQLKLTLNEAKTRLCRVPDESVDFLGYTIGRCYSPRTGRAYIGTRPSRKSVQRICRRVSEMTRRRWVLLDAEHQVSRINRLLLGWSNYFCLGAVSKAHRGVETEYGTASEAPATERAGNGWASSKPPRHTSTLHLNACQIPRESG